MTSHTLLSYESITKIVFPNCGSIFGVKDDYTVVTIYAHKSYALGHYRSPSYVSLWRLLGPYNTHRRWVTDVFPTKSRRQNKIARASNFARDSHLPEQLGNLNLVSG